MQNVLNDPFLFVIVATVIILLFTVAYILIILTSNRRIMQEQQAKIDEIRKSEERYKALFENSLAGMMKFSFAPFIVFEANRTILDMFNAQTEYDLQRILNDLPDGQTRALEQALTANGIVDAFEISFVTASGIKRRFFLSAKIEETEHLAHAVVVLMNAEKLIG